jgi:uridine monophosphate synthetase
MKKLSLAGIGIFIAMFSTDSCSAMELSHKSHWQKEREKDDLIEELYAMGAFKFGKFKLKSGQESPFYVDLRPVISHPKILTSLTQQLCEKVNACKPQFNIVCGVPYGALAIATRMAAVWECPMIMKRNEAKDHGTQNMIYGHFEKDDKVLVVEDVITTGGSVLGVVEALEKEGLKVHDIVVCLDREQKGKENLNEKGYDVHALFTITQIINSLYSNGRIDVHVRDSVKEYLRNGGQEEIFHI